jgi:hypothetical protein
VSTEGLIPRQPTNVTLTLDERDKIDVAKARTGDRCCLVSLVEGEVDDNDEGDASGTLLGVMQDAIETIDEESSLPPTHAMRPRWKAVCDER